jgi:hypothetical protein
VRDRHAHGRPYGRGFRPVRRAACLGEDAFFGGWRLPALLAAMTEGVIAVSAPIWVQAFVQRHLNRSGRLRRALARSSYAVFVMQGPVLVALALALRPTDLPGDVKALVVAPLECSHRSRSVGCSSHGHPPPSGLMTRAISRAGFS